MSPVNVMFALALVVIVWPFDHQRRRRRLREYVVPLATAAIVFVALALLHWRFWGALRLATFASAGVTFAAQRRREQREEILRMLTGRYAHAATGLLRDLGLTPNEELHGVVATHLNRFAAPLLKRGADSAFSYRTGYVAGFEEATGQARRLCEANGQQGLADAVGAMSQRLVLSDAPDEPIPMLLQCPRCHEPHIDRDEWATRPHRTHRCAKCSHEWRPSARCTVGVAQLGEAAPYRY